MKWFGETMEETFNNNQTNNLRGLRAYKAASDFEIARRVGGGKAMDLRSEPQNETDRALFQSREILDRLRRMTEGRE